MSWDKWVEERGSDPPTYCPLEGDSVVLGMNIVGNPRGSVVGEFWFEDSGELRVRLNSSLADDVLEDGYGSCWSAICPECGGRTMQIVRPGKVQCSKCG